MRYLICLVLACALTSAPVSAEAAPRRPLVAVGDTWRWSLGAEAPATWRDESFDDSGWNAGPSGFGFADDDDATIIPDRMGSHVSLVLRTRFEATPADAAGRLVFVVRSDDGFVAWLNGHEIARARIEGDPPAFDALATDHEATRFEEFVVPPGILRSGMNLLCVQAHDSHPESSDFTIEPQLLVETTTGPATAPPASRPGESARRPARRPGHATTLAAFRASNYFQGRADSRKEAVLGQHVRQELRLRPGGSPLTLSLRGDIQRVGSLGTSLALDVRASWSFERRRDEGRRRHEAWISADATWNRPAFRLGDDLATGDSWGLDLGWLADVGRSLRFGAEAGLRQEDLELDSRRDNDIARARLSLRFLRDSRPFSPELAVEGLRRSAGAEAFEYEERRIMLRIRSRPADRVRLGVLLRLGLRDYSLDRDDRRRTLRVTGDFTLRDNLDLVSYLAWEDGQSSLDGRAFEGTFAWLGLRMRY